MKRSVTITVPLVMFAATVDFVHQMYKGYAVLSPKQNKKLLQRLFTGISKMQVDWCELRTPTPSQATIDLEAGEMNHYTKLFERIYIDALSQVRVNLKRSIPTYQNTVNTTIRNHASFVWERYRVDVPLFCRGAATVLMTMMEDAGIFPFKGETPDATPTQRQIFIATTPVLIAVDIARRPLCGHQSSSFIVPMIAEPFYQQATRNPYNDPA